MSKAFIKDNDDNDEPEQAEIPTGHHKNYVTPMGLSQLQNELQQLLKEERPKTVEVVRWAAGNGDRSENGDYIYGKKRLREIDRRVRYLVKRLDNAQVVDPELQKKLTKVFFGATVNYIDEDGHEHTVKIVGIDEANLTQGKISWVSPLAKALLKSQAGDAVKVHTPKGQLMLKVVSVKY